MLGEVVVSSNSKTENKTIDISSFNDGTYILKIESNKEVVTRKINLIK